MPDKSFFCHNFSMAENDTSLDMDRIQRETTVLYDGPEGKIVIPHTFHATTYWGKDTRWCVARKNDNFRTENTYAPIMILITEEDGKIALCDGIIYTAIHEKPADFSPATQRLYDAMLTALPAQAEEINNNMSPGKSYRMAPQQQLRFNPKLWGSPLIFGPLDEAQAVLAAQEEPTQTQGIPSPVIARGGSELVRKLHSPGYSLST